MLYLILKAGEWRMFKLVVVDDEEMTRKHLENILDWDILGFEIVASFSDAQSVLEYLACETADVVLTDIKMESISGLELAKRLSEDYPHITVVIISGHREFEYVREALKYNTYDYILKPVTYEEFYEVF